MKIVDLFSGREGWTRYAQERGHDVFSIDFDPAFDADAVIDLRYASEAIAAIPWENVDILFASPMCNAFSTMSMGKMWHPGAQAKPKHDIASDGMSMVLATLRIIALKQPTLWFVENPKARLRSLELMEGIPVLSVWQCHLGRKYAKPTDLFTNLTASKHPTMFSRLLDLECHNQRPNHHPNKCCCRDHVSAPRGSKTGVQGGTTTEESGTIPYQLGKLIIEEIEYTEVRQ